MSLSPFDLLALTCNSLRSNPVRSTLTTLGVFMGVAAVSATLQVGSISRAVIAKQLAERDAPQVSLYMNGELRSEDMEYLRQRLEGVRAISASSGFYPNPQTLFQDEEAQPNMRSVTQDFLLTSGKQLVAGRFFTPADFENYRPVVVLDQFLVDKLFKGQKAVGETIYANSRPYVVVGVVPTVTPSFGEPEGEVLIPMSFYYALTGSRDLGSFKIRPYKIEDLEDLADKAKQLMEQRFPGKEVYAWNNVDEILAQQQTLEMASNGLTAVGIISLLIGGVGIANITIAAVMERTPEIGLRRAIGAKRRDILLQFILEAAILSLLGGTAAIISVHGLTMVVAETFKLPYEFESKTAALSLGSALLVGVGAGFLPAVRASRLDPVKALRNS
ncbi:ABC transporter permease [Trichocoleus sp. DQ-A3]|uniref:ABC transporter permease n=1 Tax=Cyanophyceae TaxID=3028117 RepID=UPI00168709B1|nr:ABC transporter permease [Coleofasciculus sp. FACHB-125]MBD1898423.1 ABC transporter permease [Coleofasciculus sp. FACHB-125]